MKKVTAILAAAAAALAPVAPAGTTTITSTEQTVQAHSRAVAVIANGTTQREIRADIFGDYLSGIAEQFHQQAGINPAQFGHTRACQRMMRRSKLARLGIGRRRN